MRSPRFLGNPFTFAPALRSRRNLHIRSIRYVDTVLVTRTTKTSTCCKFSRFNNYSFCITVYASHILSPIRMQDSFQADDQSLPDRICTCGVTNKISGLLMTLAIHSSYPDLAGRKRFFCRFSAKKVTVMTRGIISYTLQQNRPGPAEMSRIFPSPASRVIPMVVTRVFPSPPP